MSSEHWLFGISDFSTSEPLENATGIISNGFDFVEPGLAKAAAMSDEAFEASAKRLSDANIRVESMNWFLPPTVKVTGPDTDDDASRSFLEKALARAETLGAKAVVFGSPGSRSVPAGFSGARAEEQMIAFCRLGAQVIREAGFGMKIAVEHVNHTETNFINTFAQALEITRKIDRPEVGLAADFYHFAMEDEDTDILLDAADLVCAVQLADPEGRCFPGLVREIPGIQRFFKHLAEIGYAGGISVEANVVGDLAANCRNASAFFSEVKRTFS